MIRKYNEILAEQKRQESMTLSEQLLWDAVDSD